MKIQYDSAADAAYILLEDQIASGGVARTYLCDPAEAGGMINLDFDDKGRLVGIEVLGASEILSAKVLRSSTVPSAPEV